MIEFNATNFANLTSSLDELDESDSFWSKYMMFINESTSYFFYSIIFLIGITGNSVVIYVLLNSICSPNKYSLINQYQEAPTVVRRASFKPKDPANNNIDNNNNITANNSTNKKKPNVSFKKDLPDPNETNHIDQVNKGEKRQVKYSDSMIVNDPSVVIQNDNYEDTNNKVYFLVSFSNQTQNKSWLTYGKVESNYKSELYSACNGNAAASASNYVDSHPTRLKQIRQQISRLIKEKLSVTNFYLLNLALTDFSYLISIPFLLITIRMKSWIFGEFLCRFYFSLVYLCQSSSVFILVVLSIDRYLSVKYPHKVALFRSSELARIVMLISWSLSFLFITPVIIYTELNSTPNETSACRIKWPEEWNFNFTKNSTFFDHYFTPLHAFTVYTFLFNYLIPVSTIIILYSAILRRLHRKSKIRKSKTKTKSNRKITRMVMTIIVCYLICWSPYWFSQIFNYFYQYVFQKEMTNALILLSHFVQIIAYLSSALNPFIYSYMSEAFRANLKLTFQNCCSIISEDTQMTETTIVSLNAKPVGKTKKKENFLDSFFSDKNKKNKTADTNNTNENKNHRIKKDLINPVIEEKLRTSEIEKVIKAENRTFIYKTKSNFAFAINFHPFSISDKFFMRSIDTKVKKQDRLNECVINESKKMLTTSISCTTMPSLKQSHSCISNFREHITSDDSKHNLSTTNVSNSKNLVNNIYNEYQIKNIDDDEEDDDVFEHQSIISYFK